jgi:hypothetical protein
MEAAKGCPGALQRGELADDQREAGPVATGGRRCAYDRSTQKSNGKLSLGGGRAAAMAGAAVSIPR